MSEATAEREFVERLGLLLTQAGMQRMPARVLGVFLIVDAATVTAGELAERLDVSAGAISGAVRTLAEIGLVERVAVPGSRRDHYRIRDDAWYEATVEKTGLLHAMQSLAEAGIEAIGSTESPAGRRMVEMREFYAFVEAELPAMMERWRALRDSQRAALSS